MDRQYRFGPFCLEPRQRLLQRDGEQVHLPPRVFDTLVELVRNAGALVSKEHLLGSVWHGAVVEEGSLGRTVSYLRKSLGSSGFIQTVPKHGYRFAVPVSVIGTGSDQRIAVLPLLTWGVEEALGMGVTDALIAGLSGTPGLLVYSASAVHRYGHARRQAQAAGRQLGADLVVDGRLMGSAQELRATLQLLRTEDGQSTWAATVDGRPDELFSFQDRLLRELSAGLGVRRLPATASRHPDPAAYRLCLQGRYHSYRFDPISIDRALASYRQALRLAPDYAAAHAGLAATGLFAADSFLPADTIIPEARKAAHRAIELEPELAEAHASLAILTFWNDWDRAGAEPHYLCALELEPREPRLHHMFGWALTALGRFEAASRHLETAFDLDPASLPIAVDRGLPKFFAGRYEEAERLFEEGLQLDEAAWYGHYRLAQARLAAGSYESAVQGLRRALDCFRMENPEVEAVLCCCEAVMGERAAAQARLRRLQDSEKSHRLGGYEAAVVQISLGAPAAALEELGRAVAERDKWLGWVAVDPRLRSLRGAGALDAIIRAAGFVGLGGADGMFA